MSSSMDVVLHSPSRTLEQIVCYSFTTHLTVGTWTVVLPEDDGNVAVSKRPPREFKIRIRKAGHLLTSEIRKFLEDKPHDESVRFTGITLLYLFLTCVAIQALDILCRHKSAMEYFNHKNSFFTSNLSQTVGNGCEVW